ncbi:FIP (Fungus-Induced Protein) Related [Caenorhabditis elegans]|uniref:FIP (Fungus-Induced Protein) Related n=1 Tax=Caenorhabditis elegans TaxID=6239 RepID=L8EC28_CAEEL|nr:FIP (Fungus-Induced Protein) Related [Caenorhabditis elegans]CCQ25650.1 FIP (Fungus-Induced Protein) Related [Caenorhabditis elegans]|eukprot:NP_001263834.1 Uncharacterized protein CELE_K08D9.9 [Caenorhabditis elegans]
MWTRLLLIVLVIAIISAAAQKCGSDDDCGFFYKCRYGYPHGICVSVCIFRGICPF